MNYKEIIDHIQYDCTDTDSVCQFMTEQKEQLLQDSHINDFSSYYETLLNHIKDTIDNIENTYGLPIPPITINCFDGEKHSTQRILDNLNKARIWIIELMKSNMSEKYSE